MPRIPILQPEKMDADQRRVYEDVLKRTGRVAGGPSVGYAYAPGLWEASGAVSAYLEHDSTLTDAQLRIAALVTVRRWNSEFPWAAQARFALAAGVSRENVEAINARTRPAFANAEDGAVYELAAELAESGTVSDASYEKAEAALGVRKLVDVVGAVGQFTKTAMMANVAGVKAPADAGSRLR